MKLRNKLFFGLGVLMLTVTPAVVLVSCSQPTENKNEVIDTLPNKPKFDSTTLTTFNPAIDKTIEEFNKVLGNKKEFMQMLTKDLNFWISQIYPNLNDSPKDSPQTNQYDTFDQEFDISREGYWTVKKMSFNAKIRNITIKENGIIDFEIEINSKEIGEIKIQDKIFPGIRTSFSVMKHSNLKVIPFICKTNDNKYKVALGMKPENSSLIINDNITLAFPDLPKGTKAYTSLNKEEVNTSPEGMNNTVDFDNRKIYEIVNESISGLTHPIFGMLSNYFNVEFNLIDANEHLWKPNTTPVELIK